MPRSGGGTATGSGGRGCANGLPRGVRGTPRSGGTLLIFFITASRSIAYTLRRLLQAAGGTWQDHLLLLPTDICDLVMRARIALPAARCEGAREGGVCHHVARRRARGAARRARLAAGNPPPPAAQSARRARAQAPHARRVHERARLERARLERERLERERPNAARSGAPRAARLRRSAAAQQQLPQQPRVRRPLVAP